MKDWKRGLHKLELLSYLNIPVSRILYSEFNHCYRCKYWDRKLYAEERATGCLKGFQKGEYPPNKKWLVITIIGFKRYWICSDWEFMDWKARGRKK